MITMKRLLWDGGKRYLVRGLDLRHPSLRFALLRLSRTRADAYWTRAAQELTSPATDPRTAAKSRTTPRALRGKSSARVGIEPYNCCAAQLEA